jgi:Flp pilus assembly pilin Flp
MRIIQFLRALVRRSEGQDLIEYGLLVGMISAAIVAAISPLATKVAQPFQVLAGPSTPGNGNPGNGNPGNGNPGNGNANPGNPGNGNPGNSNPVGNPGTGNPGNPGRGN